jgi:hypothetical protein
MNLYPYDQEMMITIEKQPTFEKPPIYEKPTIMQKDQQFLYMQHLIEQKREMLLQKQKKLHTMAKQNQYLEVVKSDYAKYYDYIAQQKREQMQALEILNKYIQDLNATHQMSKYNIKDAKVEQQKIMGEISKIKKGLDELMSHTNKTPSV